MIIYAGCFLASRLGSARIPDIRNLLIDVVAVGVAGSRMVVMPLPFSGHLTLLTYAILASEMRSLRWIAVGLWIHATIFKLAVWHDPLTWSLGIGIGFLLYRCRRHVTPQKQSGTGPVQHLDIS